MRTWLTVLAFAGSSLAPLAADVLVVPDDQPNLQAAIDVAQAGDRIVVRTTVDQNTTGNGLIVDKSLAIVGDPVCNIGLFGPGGGLQLAGPGQARLALTRVTMKYDFSDSNGSPSLYGSGFATVRLLGCSIRHDNLFPTGLITQSFPAVDLPSVESLLVLGCDLLGGPAGSDDCGSTQFYVDGRAGIHAPNAAVYVGGSTVVGGRGGALTESTFEDCPGDLSTWGGRGGDGIVARVLRLRSSTVTGGPGITWMSFPMGVCNYGQPVACGTQPDGQAFVVGGAIVGEGVHGPGLARPALAR